MALILALVLQQTPEQHVELELQKIEALASRFDRPKEASEEEVNTCLKVMADLGAWCGDDATKIRLISRALGKFLARKGLTRRHEYYYLSPGGRFLLHQPPEDPAWLDGLVDRIDAYRKVATNEPTGPEQVDAAMAIMCSEILFEAMGAPIRLKSRELTIDWTSWDAVKTWYAEKRPALRYDPATKKYVW